MLVQCTLDLVDSRECECAARDELDICAVMLCGKDRRLFYPAKRIGENEWQPVPRVGALHSAVKQICQGAKNAVELDMFGHARVVCIRFGEMRW